MAGNTTDDDVIYTPDGTLLYNPFNPLNKEITLNEVQSILNEFGVTAKVNNIELYKRAFIHRSYTKRPCIENETFNIKIANQPSNCMTLKTKSNERLEFVGDGVLELITKYYLYRRFPKEDEGFMTEKKIALVKNEHIGKLAHQMRLNKWFVLSRNTEEKNTRNNLKKLGCLFEAFVGAMFLDFNKIEVNDEHGWFKNTFVCGPGFQMSQIFIEAVFEKFVDWHQIISVDDNFKNILQVKIQKEFRTTPIYLEISRDIDKGYTMGVYLCLGKPIHAVNHSEATKYCVYGSFSEIQREFATNKHVFVMLGMSSHNVKKKAEQAACEEALAIINN